MRSVALFAFAIAGVWAFQGCASDANSGYHGASSKPDGGVCNPAFCPPPVNGGAPCCINDHCGYDLGRGCVDPGHVDGG